MNGPEMILAALGAANLLLLVALLLRRPPAPDLTGVAGRFDALDRGQERMERLQREEAGAGREQAAGEARALRTEVSAALQALGEGVLRQLEVIGRSQQEKLDQVVAALHQLTEASRTTSAELRSEVNASIRTGSEWTLQAMGKLDDFQRQRLEKVAAQVEALSTANEARLEALRQTVDAKLQSIREDNATQLEQMRQTVNEQLQGTLERRLGESFQLVSTRLEEVHKGLGEMQTLATGVGDLKRVLTNVKVRGTWGEVQLGNLLEQVLAPEQYAANVATRPGSAERVEFAVRLPGRGEGSADTVWLPIDAKFPQEDYQRLVEAQERGDPAAAEESGRQLEARVRQCAKDICARYLDPPGTTDFAILFLPTEGLFAETIRRPGVVEAVQRESRVLIAGPTTLAALLNSLQMGFRTLAIQKRSSEVWEILGAVKTEFGRFGGVIQKVQKKLQEATNVMDTAAQRSRAMERRLRSVEALPAADATLLLGGGPGMVDLEELVDPPAS